MEVEAQYFVDFVTEYGPKARSGAHDPKAIEKLHDEREELSQAVAAGDVLGMLSELADVAWYTAKVLFAALLEEAAALDILDTACQTCGVSRSIALWCMETKYRHRLAIQINDDAMERKKLEVMVVPMLVPQPYGIWSLLKQAGHTETWLKTHALGSLLRSLLIIEQTTEEVTPHGVLFVLQGQRSTLVGWVEACRATLYDNGTIPEPWTGADLGLFERINVHAPVGKSSNALTKAEIMPILMTLLQEEAAS